ncbi:MULTISPECIES: stage II sporulation protein E [Clostridium]|uniref:stage II sporulation protein E n=1 Tax=Clostridium TaxID=1485 RepID=UPI000174E647|nr:MULTISPECIES: stage II sporulation protein E [Clostridium]ACD51340.1 stage II sporulation protein E [Clostridium botulinum E3 str. Alaska E43]AJF28269.1 sporulation protein [Clostridium botulinum]AJF31329.1 sporulation protein [Clostridium botulinum]MBN1034080.1 stage II sporulation protein E [Clostridium botulinum]MBN1069720.1 stage II sporulation protein E [Clostridium botulinum]
MQYELNVNAYKNKKVKKSFLLKMELSRMIFILIGGLLLSRVTLLFSQTQNNGVAPLGIAYLIVIGLKCNRSKTAMASIGVLLGYLTINSKLPGGMVYLITAAALTLYYEVLNKSEKRKKEFASFFIVFLSFVGYSVFANNYDLGVNITLALINALVVLPVYYIIKYAFNCLDEINSNYFFTSEEIVSMAILFCLFVAGIGDISIKYCSLRNVLALLLVVTIAYIGGASYGATMGVAMGIILGCSSNNMMASVGFYGVGGLVIGIFKDTGKIFSVLSGILIYFALGLYSESINSQFIIEVGVSLAIFLFIPKNLYKNIELEINTEKKQESINQIHLNELKDEFTLKLKDLTCVLNQVSKTLEDMEDNDRLLIKNKSCEFVESLADRVCIDCEKKNSCWRMNFNSTYNSFQTLIKSAEEESPILPKTLEASCVKHFTLLKSAQDIVTNHIVNSNIKDRFSEGRQIISSHINNISYSLSNVLDEFKREVTICSDLERIIKRGLNKSSIEYNDIFCYTDKNGRVKIKLTIKDGENCEYYENKLIPLLNDIMHTPLCIIDNGYFINRDTNMCTLLIEEMPKYNVISYGAMASKKGETRTGDSYSFGKATDGSYMTILSDGMGSGPDAEKESKATVDLVEKFMEAGFDEEVTINTMNSIMGMKFSESEKYATLDLSKIDLYSGEVNFVKIGAASSFIKRGDDILVVDSKNLPFGLVDEMELDIIKEEVMPGDILINVSDGILDIDKLNSGNFIWLKEYLKDCCTDPRELSENILQKAMTLSENMLKDDMTVLVSKVYAV